MCMLRGTSGIRTRRRRDISLPYQGTQTNKLFPHPSYRHYSHGRICQWKERKDANDTDTFNCCFERVILITVQSSIIHLILKPTLHHQNITANAHLIEPIPLISLHTILSCSPSCASCKSSYQPYPDSHSIHLTNPHPWNHSPQQIQHSPTKRFNETILLKTHPIL